MAHAHVSSGGRYPVLRSVAILFLINAIAVIAAGLYGTYYALTESGLPAGDRLRWAVLTLAATFFATLITVGIAEMIKLVLDIEHNTRSSAKSAAESASGKKWMDGEETAEGALMRGR